MNSQTSKHKLGWKDRFILQGQKMNNDPKRKQMVMIRLQQLAKDAGIRGYSTLSQEELMVAIEVEAKYKSKIMQEFLSLKEQLRLDEEKREKRSFMDELERI